MAKKHLVVLSGAGISAESGLKTFRDSDGLWEGFDVYEVATPRGFAKNPQLVLDFYNMRRKDVAAAYPNEAHKVLAELEKQFDVTIITQNIDDLHERAGSSNVMHLHGEIFKMRSCANSNTIYNCSGEIHVGDLAEDGSQLRPHIVWFEEPVPMIEAAIAVIETADLFLVVGTSLAVYPAAGLVQYAAPAIPKFMVDKNIPDGIQISKLITIEQPATLGMKILQERYLPLYY